MTDFVTKLYHLVDEDLPVLPLEYSAEKALEQTLSPEQKALFEAYQMECFRNTEVERLQLFRCTLSVGHRLACL